MSAACRCQPFVLTVARTISVWLYCSRTLNQFFRTKPLFTQHSTTVRTKNYEWNDTHTDTLLRFRTFAVNALPERERERAWIQLNCTLDSQLKISSWVRHNDLRHYHFCTNKNHCLIRISIIFFFYSSETEKKPTKFHILINWK